MTIEACYEAMGGNYNEVKGRLQSPRLIEKFALKFLEDKSFQMLCDAMQAGNREEAFRAAHTLKGVCANLSFSRLMKSASELTELLRQETDTISETADLLMKDVQRDYQMTVDVICQYKNEMP